jgi:hypothetical protein
MMTNIDSSIGAMPRGTMEGVKNIPGAQHRYEGARPGPGRRPFLALGWTPALIAGTFADAAGWGSCRQMIEQAAAVEGGLLRSTPHSGPRRSLLIHPRINPLVDVAKPIGDLITPSSRPSGGSPLRQAQKRIAGRVHS